MSAQGDLITGEFKTVTACRCESCAPGDPAPTYTEAHRHACEVRFVISLPSNERRKAYLEAVADFRGHEAYQRLRRDAWNALQALSASRARALEPA